MPTDLPPPSAPRRAVVFAAGFGERMLPISAVCPKPLLPLWGRPALTLALERLRAWGVEETLINLHYGADAVWRAAIAGAPTGLRLCFSYEPHILGTGGALRRAAWFFGDEPFWICNADVVGAPDPRDFLHALRRRHVLAAVWLHPTRGPRTVEVRRDRVVSFRSERAGHPGTYTFCGLHLVSPHILDFISRQEQFETIIAAYERAITAGAVVAAVVSDAWWADLGVPEDYLAAHMETREAAHRGRVEGEFYDARAERRARRWLARAGARARGFVYAEAPARIGRGASLENTVLLAGAAVASGAASRNAIVAGDVVARGMVQRAVGPAAAALKPAEAAALRNLGWRVESASIEALPPRGSGRTFWRLTSPRKRAILIRYGPERPENARYATHARFLQRQGLPVPRVLADSPLERFVMLEDLGDRTLTDTVRGISPDDFLRRYEVVVDLVADWHEYATRAARRNRISLEPAFGPTLYRYERDLFLQRYLDERLGLPAPQRMDVERDLRRVARRLMAAPLVLLHRDLQSSNILLKRERPCFIDFQGMRYGPAMYDVASLLCDPYVEFPAGAREHLLTRYIQRRRCMAEAETLFWPAAVERLCQAIGAFAQLAALPGGAHFAAFIPAAVERLREAVERAALPLPALWAILP